MIEEYERVILSNDRPFFNTIVEDVRWDFMVKPSVAFTDDIEKPTIELHKDYYPDIKKYVSIDLIILGLPLHLQVLRFLSRLSPLHSGGNLDQRVVLQMGREFFVVGIHQRHHFYLDCSLCDSL